MFHKITIIACLLGMAYGGALYDNSLSGLYGNYPGYSNQLYPGNQGVWTGYGPGLGYGSYGTPGVAGYGLGLGYAGGYASSLGYGGTGYPGYASSLGYSGTGYPGYAPGTATSHVSVVKEIAPARSYTNYGAYGNPIVDYDSYGYGNTKRAYGW